MEDRLSTLAGVRASREWLVACRQHIQTTQLNDNNNNNSNIDEDDGVLHQILHTDLRHVVRCFDTDAVSTSNAANNANFPSVILRNAVKQSMPNNVANTNSSNDIRQNSINQCEITLPTSFRHMVQIEELLDVSLNAEERVSVGPTASSSPTPVGNQKLRCLKMALSDGYFDDGLCNSTRAVSGADDDAANSSAKIMHLVAMETAPIPNLSVHSKAGIKVVLSGNITVRMGVIMLNEGNAIVLGGCVPALMEVQRKAKEMAKRIAGVGVDPTVRALIWNPHTGMEEDDDEGEEESGDMQQSMQTQFPSNPAANITDRNHARSTNSGSANVDQNNIPIGNNNSILNVQPSQYSYQERQPQELHQTRLSSSAVNLQQQQTSNSTERSNLTNRNYSACEVDERSMIERTSPSANVRESRPSPPKHISNNPYAKSYFNSNCRQQSIKTKNTTRTPEPTGMPDMPVDLTSPEFSSSPVTVPPPQYKDLNSTSNALDNQQHPSISSLPTCPPSKVAKHTPSSQESSTDGPTNDIITTTTQERAHHSLQTSLSPPNPLRPAMNLSVSPTALSEPLSFQEMRSLLVRMIIDPELYGKYTNKTFVVPCKRHPKQAMNMGFNIEKVHRQKNKSKSTGKLDKYGYVMICRMTGTNKNDGIITCKLSNEIVQPLMGVGPGEMRKMHREDRDKANAITNEGGMQVLSEFETLSSCHMKLLYSRDDFFSQSSPFNDSPQVDGDFPIMVLFARNI